MRDHLVVAYRSGRRNVALRLLVDCVGAGARPYPRRERDGRSDPHPPRAHPGRVRTRGGAPARNRPVGRDPRERSRPNPPRVLLDEPSSGLDATETNALVDVFRQLRDEHRHLARARRAQRRDGARPRRPGDGARLRAEHRRGNSGRDPSQRRRPGRVLGHALVTATPVVPEPTPAPLLTVDAARGRLRRGACAVRGVVHGRARPRVAVLGANGAGKSSLAGAVACAVRARRGRILLAGVDVTRWAPHRVIRAGVAFVPEGRGIFPHLTVIENLRARCSAPRCHPRARAAPRSTARSRRSRCCKNAGVKPRGRCRAASSRCSRLARVLAAPPRLLVADEMSLGLAPRMVDLVFDGLRRVKADGVTIVLVEQYVERGARSPTMRS